MNSKSIHFSIATPKHILKQSVVEVSSTSLYRVKQRIPVDNGVLSLRMGSLDRRLRCSTCGNDTLQCPGHFGHISFAAPIYHVGYIKQIVKMLRNFCYFCAELLRCSAATRRIATSALRQRRISSISTASSETVAMEVEKTNSRCVHCQGVIPIYKADGHKVNISWPENKSFEKSSKTLSAKKALSLIDRAKGLLGKQLPMYTTLKRLRNAILTVLIVPPPCIRPSVVHEFGGKNRGQDDLTRSLNSIVQWNNKLQAQMSHPENLFGKADKTILAELQWTVSSYMNNDVRGEKKATTRIGGASRDLRNRLVGKNGRMRSTQMGKRVNYSARDPITPDVHLDVDVVGVPLCIAEILLKPVLVNNINIAQLTAQLKKGIVKFVTVEERGQPSRRILIDLKKPENFPLPLQIGWTVERAMLDNDYVVMNRHPSLHRVSMMAHRVKILKEGLLTFRLNPAVCPPYNADFDGDEMNLHLPTTLEAAAELQELMAVQKHIMSPQNSRLALGAVQDCALGLYLLSEPVILSRGDFFHLLTLADAFFDASTNPDAHVYTGYDLVSLFLPPNFSLLIPGSVETSIVNGKIISGRLSRSIIHSIISAVVLDFGQDSGLKLLGQWQLLACSFLSYRGFSIGLDDCTIDEDSSEAISSFIDSALAKVSKSILPGHVKAQALSSMLGNLTAIAQRNTGKENSIVLMSTSGAKGNSVNLTQIRGAVGQQTINGARVAGTLPAFAHDDFCCERFGFIRSSYTAGLTPTEFFHHAMSGREGIVDTAVKTADTGYLGRRLAKGFESVRTHYGDSSVRNAFGEILQFAYGNDGCDAMWLERFSIAAYMGDKFITSSIKSSETDLCYLYRDILKKLNLLCKNDSIVFIPCDINRLLLLAQSKFSGFLATHSGEPEYTRSLVRELLDCLGGPSNQSTVIYQACIALCLQYKNYFEYCPSIEARRWVLSECLARYERARVAPGEMVGIVAAQSIAQPSTQLTLNTFHYAGVLAYNVTLGLPRLKELTDASSSPSSPTLIIPCFKGTTASPKPFVYRNIGHYVTTDSRATRVSLDFEKCVADGISPLDIAAILDKACPGNIDFVTAPNLPDWYIDLKTVPGSSILKLTVAGFPEFKGISSVALHSSASVSRFSPYQLDCENVLITAGTNLLDFFGHAMSYDSAIDVYSTYSNHILEVYAVLGIEAAAALLIAELRHVLSFDGTFVHDRHFQLIVDVMTQTGSIMPLSRHGLNKNMNTGILARASFEATVDQLLEGALRNEVDYLRGVSENIFMGLTPPMGTGTFDTISNCPLIRNGLVTVLIPKNTFSQHGSAAITKTTNELSRVFHLANLLVPFNVSSFCYDSKLLVPDNGALSMDSTENFFEESGSVVAPTECLEISSMQNSFSALKRRSSAAYRPSSPIAFEQSTAPTARAINPLELLRDIYSNF